MMRDITVVLTCCGNSVSPGMVESLRKNGERIIKIIGFDMVNTPLASSFVDKFIKVPAGNSPEYISRVLNICKKEKVNVLLPCDDNEALALAEHRGLFESMGTKIAVSGIESLKKSFNKISFHQHLESCGIKCARYKIATNYAEVEEAVFSLGFPAESVVVKPEFGFGGRGVRTVVSKICQEKFFNQKSDNIEISLESLKLSLSDYTASDLSPRLLVTEYLPGDYYSVETLSQEGRPSYIIPKRRIIGSASCTTFGRLDFNSKVIKKAQDICNAFKFDFIQNYEIKLNDKGEPIPYDLNPRIPASIAMSTAAGANLLYFAVKMALEEEIPKVKLKSDLIMTRYYKELYV